MQNTLTLSSSSISTFLSCRKRYEYEKIRHIYPVERPVALDMGSAIHKGLATAYGWRLTNAESDSPMPEPIEADRVKAMAVETVDLECKKALLPVEDQIKARVLIEKYIEKYWQIDSAYFLVLELEKYFRLPLINPDTGRQSRKYFMRGYVDAVFLDGIGCFHIVEHKTAGQTNDGYFERVAIDWQVAIYADMLSREYGTPIHDVIYDVIKKPQHKMSVGETDEEFEARKAASKTGKVKRKEAETPEAFYQRLSSAVTEDYFIRKHIELDEGTLQEFRREIWAVAHEIGECKTFYKCTGNCLSKGTCPYMKLCCAKGNLDGLEELYTCELLPREMEIENMPF